ncbi:hypothetical protein GOODEAATRI_034061 [Goodea atripinnis]|uniref:Uncharacterized protein n=1 Tax=Goodea atripinnis TaxID=208336 RepID=A0ABV0P0A3_9TELE
MSKFLQKKGSCLSNVLQRAQETSIDQDVHFYKVQPNFTARFVVTTVSHFLYHFFHSGSRGSWCLSPAVYGGEAGFTLDRSPVHHRATHKQPHTPKENLERPINLTGMCLDCGRKLEYPVRTHACTGRTCKLHAERPPAGNRTRDLLAARQQCYQLRHCA